MSWVGVLAAVLAIVLVAAVTGMKPDGGRPASRTRLMAVARVILLLVVATVVLSALF